MADQEKEILEEEMEQDLSDAEELKEEETEDEEPVSKEDKKAAKKQAKLNKKPIAYAWIRLPASLPACFCVNRNSRIKNGI